MKIYGAIQKIEEEDDGTIRIHGIASTEDMDSAGEIIRADAMRAAIPGYEKFPSLREMHGLSAAGTTLEIDVGDDNITRIVGHVVDPIAVKKCLTGTYRGLSIGGKVLKRDPADRKVITGIDLREISLVDRPCNGSCSVTLMKIGGVDVTDEQLERADTADALINGMDPEMSEIDIIDPNAAEEVSKRDFDAKQRRADAKDGSAMKDGSFPIKDKEDLKNAIRLAGKAKNPAAARAHIKRRAAALGASDMIPSDWKDGGAKKADGAEDGVTDPLEKAVEPAPLSPTRIVDVLNDARASMDTALNAPVAGKHVDVALPGGSTATETAVANPEEAGQATPKSLNETAVAAVESVAGETPTPGTDTRTHKDPSPGSSTPPRSKAPRNATQDTGKAAAGGKPTEEREPPEEENATQDTADKKKKKKDEKEAADAVDPIAAARAAADNALKAATAVLQRLAKQEAGSLSPVLTAGAELRKGLSTTGRLGYLLLELSYILSESKWEEDREGDGSTVPAKLRTALDSLAAAYKSMSDEETQELLDAADKTMGGQIALAAAGGDLAKALDGVVDEDALAKMVDAPERDALAKAQAERDELVKTIGGMAETMTALAAKVEAIENTAVAPKTLTKAADIGLVAVGKEQDGQPRAEDIAKASVLDGGNSQPTEEDVHKALLAMSPEDRAMLILKASLSPANARVYTR